MIWNSVPVMTAIDLVVMVMTGIALWIFIRNRITLKPLATKTGPALIVLGLFSAGLFYFADLMTMHALPLFFPMADEMAAMEILHRDLSWLFVLVTVVSILVGFMLITRDQKALIRKIEVSKRDLSDRLAELEEVEKALRKSESLFRITIDHLPVGLNVKNPDGRYLLVNDTMANRYGLPKEEFIGKTNEEIFPEAKKSNEAARAQELELIKTKKITRRIQEKEFQDGTLHTLLIDKFPIFDDEGNLVSIGVTGVDITEQKEAEQAWKKSEQRLRGAIESLQEGFALFDADDRLVAANDVYRTINPKAQEFLDKGMTFEDLLRANVAQGRMMEAIGREEDFIRERIEQHHNPKGRIIRQYNDGKWFILQEVRTPEGGTALTFINITELKQAEEALKESQARLVNILDNSPAPIYFKDTEGRFLLANRRYQEMYDVKFEDIKGKNSKEIFGNKLGKEYFEHDQEVLNSRKAIKREENFLGRTYLTLKFPIVDPSGVLLGLGGVETDVTEIKAAEEGHRQALVKADEANQAKSEFLATMSHELRTPLNAILGFADILYNQYLGPPGQGQYREYAGDIQASGEHLLKLVNDLLDLSTIEAGKQSLFKEKLSTMEIVTECERMVEEKAHSNGIDLLTEVAQDLPPLYADRRASKQILLNLLSNAVKFTPQGGKVTVSVKASKRNTTFKIADTGKGIPAELLPKLTDPFIRANTNPYVAEQGWGLGLAITKSLIDLHDGTMDIKSKVGKGTTVTVTFPNGAF